MLTKEQKEAITKWRGWKHKRVAVARPPYMGEEWAWFDGEVLIARYLPDYDKDDVAVALLSVLVKEGYHPELYYAVDSETYAAWYFSINPGCNYHSRATIAQAVCAAILEIIES